MVASHMSDVHDRIKTIARNARAAARSMGKSDPAARNRALQNIAKEIRGNTAAIVAANAKDLAAGEKRNLSSALLDRLRLTDIRLEEIGDAINDIAALPEVVGRVENTQTRPNGLEVSRVRIPLGVIGIIYESRPNVTSDAAALCIKSGNVVILRGGSEAFHSNLALGRAVATGLDAAGLPAAAVQVVDFTDRAAIQTLLTCSDDVDVIIPRGGESLIQFVVEHSRIPVLKHYRGVCSVFIHEDADIDMAMQIAENAKVQRPGVCNAAETILVDSKIAPQIVPKLCQRLQQCGVEIRGDQQTQNLAEGIVAATQEDWSTEYLDRIVSMRVVPSMSDAIAHIEQYGSDHTDAIITQNEQAANQFIREVNSSTVVVNASTRFADGGQLGLGAEIGISTTRLHAYGPMGAESLTTTKFVVRGQGQIRK